jgi:tetratricopeptide (TPR) repeat protein
MSMEKMMSTKLETAFRKFSWETSRRASLSGLITEPLLEHALQLHIAGRYEEAIAELAQIPDEKRGSPAWRIVGHAEHGRGNHEIAIAAHMKSRAVNKAKGDLSSVCDDEVNLAAVLISMRRYEDAWEATERARTVAPRNPASWLPRISILNRQGRAAELEKELRTLLREMPEFADSSRFRDHLENDTDFIGVADLIARIRREPCVS